MPAGALLVLLAAVLVAEYSRSKTGLPIPSDLKSVDPLSLGLGGLTVLLAAGLCWTLLGSPSAARFTPWLRSPGAGRAGSQADFQEASRRLVEVQEAVRRQTADYLHGHLQAKLVAVSLSISVCQKTLRRDPTQAYRMLGSIQEQLKRIQDEDLRRVSRDLYPAVIRLGLVPALQSLVDRFKEVMEIEVAIDPEVQVLDLPGGVQLPEKLRLGVYRVTEEALTNVLKHAQASHVKICLRRQGADQLLVSVTDNGRGFDPASAAGSHGLLGLADYAQAIGGRAHIGSAPGQGATIGLLLPVPWPSTPQTPMPDDAAALPPAA